MVKNGRLKYNFWLFISLFGILQYFKRKNLFILDSTRLPMTRWVKLSLNFDSQSRAYM